MIRIHHLSDLHWGIFSKAPGHVDRGLKSGLASPRSVYDQYLAFLRGLSRDDAPDFVVISGDLSSVGEPKDLELARVFVVKIREALSKIWGAQPDPNQRLIIVPGNHDYSYTAVDQRGWEEARKEFHDRFQEYITPHREFRGGGLSGVCVHLAGTERTGPVAFYCIDTCGVAGNVDPHVVQMVQSLLQAAGAAPAGQVQETLRAIGRKDPGVVKLDELRAGLEGAPAIPAGALKICVAHHPLHSAASPDVDQYPALINAGSLRVELAKQQVHVVLSGHVHSHDTVLQYPVEDDRFGWGIYSSVGGTFGSFGDTQDCFSSLEFEPLPSPTAGATDGWLCRISKFESQRGAIARVGQLGSFFVERDQQTLNRHLAIHRARSPVANHPRRDDAQKAHGKLARFLKSFDLPPTLGVDRVEGLHDWVPVANRIYAVDVQAFDAWLDPLVFYYFCLQIPRYVSKSLDADHNRWTLRLTPLVYSATQNALRFFGGRLSKTNFRLNPPKDHHTHLELRDPSKEENLVEIARVLLWNKETLCSEDGRSFCKMHDALRIPLFYLDPAEDELGNDESYKPWMNGARPELGEVSEEEWNRQVPSFLFNEANLMTEYIYGLADENFQGGLYVDLAAEKPEDRPFLSLTATPIKGRFHHRIHFEQLLRHKKLRFASDAIHDYTRREQRN